MGKRKLMGKKFFLFCLTITGYYLNTGILAKINLQNGFEELVSKEE